MNTQYYQVDALTDGIGTSVEQSITPGPNQRIVLDTIWWYFYAATNGDMAQVDTSAVSPIQRKTLLYFNASAAVHYAPQMVRLNQPLNPGENFTVYVNGGGATSFMNIIVWYHIEDIEQQTNQYINQMQSCGFIDGLLGRC